MSAYEARIKTKFGELVISFSDKADLEKKLSQAHEFTTTIEESVGSILVKEPGEVIQGLEDIYTIGTDGMIKLLKYPKQKAALLRLALFLSSTSLTPTQLKKITGVDNPLAYMAGKDFIANPDSTYTISSDARAEVMNKIIPSLRTRK